MRVGTVCTGIGAPEMGWKGLGWEYKFFSEIEPFPCHVLAHRYGAGRPMAMPSPYDEGLALKEIRARKAAIKGVCKLPETGLIPNLGDMNQILDNPLIDELPIDLLCGGTPCQSFSVAGLRKGLDDPRGNLMFAFLAIAARTRARWLVWENVPGVLSSNGGRDFGSFLWALGQIGYGWAYRTLDAQHFGVAQRRKRVFLVGYLGNAAPATAVLFERHSLQRHPKKGGKTGQAVAGTLAARAGGGHGTSSQEARGGMLTPFTSNGYGGYGEGIGTLRADGGDSGAGSETIIAPTLDASYGTKYGLDNQHIDGGAGLFVYDTTQITSPQCRANPKANDPRHALASNQHPPLLAFRASGQDGFTPSETSPPLLESHGGGAVPTVAFRHTQSVSDTGIPSEELSPSLRAGDAQGLSVSGNPHVGVRRLTPTECARLQGFPDDFLDIPYRGKAAADGPKYRALGNSMAVPVIGWVGGRIQQVEDILREHKLI